MLTLAAAAIGACHGGAPIDAAAASGSLWQVLECESPVPAWKTIFGASGERGEYMDGYAPTAMLQRCTEDYKWDTIFSSDDFGSQRAEMMSHLYENDELWEHVSMVAFAEHYVLVNDKDNDGDNDHEVEAFAAAKPFETFTRQKDSQPEDRPIFGGVVLTDWEQAVASSENGPGRGMDQKLVTLQQKGIDYVRLECNFGSVEDIGGPAQLADNEMLRDRFGRLAKAAKACQNQEMVPLVLLQVPWREPEDSMDYFDTAVQSFARALQEAGVDSKRVLFETRPPIGVSSQDEKSLPASERVSLGLEIGQKMFECMDAAFGETPIAGFCVAGGSTKGDLPTAMEDDTQNAVRQGLRRCARKSWGYELCFWEMGAKLMLQPKVGRLWGTTRAGRDAARELFRVNAKDLADEIQAGL